MKRSIPSWPARPNLSARIQDTPNPQRVPNGNTENATNIWLGKKIFQNQICDLFWNGVPFLVALWGAFFSSPFFLNSNGRPGTLREKLGGFVDDGFRLSERNGSWIDGQKRSVWVCLQIQSVY